MTRKRDVLYLCLTLVLAWIPLFADSGSIGRAARLYPLAESAHPYFIPDHAGFLYCWLPIVVMSTFVLLLSPGLLLSIALNTAKDVGSWLLFGLTFSIITLSVTVACVQAIAGKPLAGGAFILVVIILSILSTLVLLIRLHRGASLRWPLGEPHARITILSMVLVPAVLLATLIPKFFWENFNGDGASMLETSRLLLVQSLPFWHSSAGSMAAWPGITSMLCTYPGSWFIRLFGETEASARLPFLLYLAALYGALLACISHGRNKPPGKAEIVLLWIGPIIYSITMAFSATYNPYFADIALPATQDTLTMVCFLGFLLMFLQRAIPWIMFFAVLTYLSLPNGILLIGFWLLAAFLCLKPRPMYRIKVTAGTMLLCILFSAIVPLLLVRLNAPLPGYEYGIVGLLRRFAFLQFSDVRRLAFLVVPCGILPACALGAWKWQDRMSRAVALLTIAYFVFFYFQAHIVLHHFVPVMILPCIIFWRISLIMHPRYRNPLLAFAAGAGSIALLISLPTDASLHTAGRTVGEAIDDRIGGYRSFDHSVFKRADMLHYLLPYAWDPCVPSLCYGGSPLIWNYYAHHRAGRRHDINYVIQQESLPVPHGMEPIITEEGISLYVRDLALWHRHRTMHFPTPAGSPIYALPRSIIFRSVPHTGVRIISIVAVIERLGFDLDPLLNRLGVKRR